MYHVLGVSVALASFGATAIVVSAVVSRCWPRAARAAGKLSPRGEARFLLALLLLPTTAALSSLVLASAAWMAWEPARTAEPLGVLLASGALLASLLLLLGALRGYACLAAARRLAREWLATGRRVELPGVPIPVYRIAHPLPVLCVIGVFRPRLFVADRVLEACTTAELAAALAHESSHIASRDNLRGVLVRSLPDLLALLPGGRRLRRAWELASEAAADASAARINPGAGLDLASALLRVARLSAGQESWGMPVRALVDGEGVSPRVERLLRGHEPSEAPVRQLALFWALVLAVPGLVLCAAGQPATLQTVHRLAEWLVHLP